MIIFRRDAEELSLPHSEFQCSQLRSSRRAGSQLLHDGYVRLLGLHRSPSTDHQLLVLPILFLPLLTIFHLIARTDNVEKVYMHIFY